MSIAEVVIGAIACAALALTAASDAAAVVGSALEWVRDRCWPRRRSSVGPDALIGLSAKVTDPFHPAKSGRLCGKVELRGEIWNARLDRDGANPPAPSSTVRVIGVDELTLVVSSLNVEAGRET